MYKTFYWAKINYLIKINKFAINVHSNLCFNLCLSATGISDTKAKIVSTATEVHDHASLVEVNVWRVWPACMATNDGGATPKIKRNYYKLSYQNYFLESNNHEPKNITSSFPITLFSLE